MNREKLNQFEKEVVTDFENDEFDSVLAPQRQNEIKQIAGNAFKKDKRINIRISSRDLNAIQRRALQEGIPYQTLVSSILHEYVSGSLYDVTANQSAEQQAN